MSRATNAVTTKARHKKVLKAAKGYYGTRGRLYRMAREAVRKGWLNAFDGRKKKKGDFRSLWIARIGIASKQRGVSYSKLVNKLSLSKIMLNRKMLADIAVNDAKGFDAIIEKLKVKSEK